MKGSSLGSRSGSLVCPLCEADWLRISGNTSARCESCGEHISKAVLQSLQQVATLPVALGDHPCECGHPEMRRLPDGIYHCPACGSEVLPPGTSPVVASSDDRGEAYWAGWLDGCFGASGSFVDNLNLARFKEPSDRLAYYRGHRAGREAGYSGAIDAATLTNREGTP